MDKSCHSSGEESSSSAINPNPNNLESTTTINTNPKDHYNNNPLNQIHKLSHKISKPPIRKPFEYDHNHQIQSPPLILDHHHHPGNESQPSNLHLQQQQQQHQPPVYNVSKSDFRDVVQKLTGSPAHERVINPVQSQPVKPQSSRLQRIRPPPLEQVGKFPLTGQNPRFFSGQRPLLSPLPPLPAVHATAESPISAYMRCFQTNVTGFSNPLPVQQNPSGSLSQPELHAPNEFHAPPSSPLPFGCLSPGFQFSPAIFQQLTPLSPTPPAPSPRWKSN